MVLDTTLLNTKHYKVRIKGKVEQSRERSGAPPLHLGIVAIEKVAFGPPSTTVANFTYNLPNGICKIQNLSKKIRHKIRCARRPKQTRKKELVI